MLKSFSVKNFRVFEEQLDISNLQQVNLIAGKNNVGKTALLEALFLLMGAGNTSLTLIINRLRGVEPVTLDTNELWGWLFNNRKFKNPIQIHCKDSNSIEHELTLQMKQPNSTEYRPESKPKPDSLTTTATTVSDLFDLYFNYKNNANSNTIESKASIINNQITFQTPPKPPFPFSVFIGSHERISQNENSQRFSQLEAIGNEQEIVNTLKLIEPNLKRLAISTISGQPEIRADIGTKILMPISYMGDGVNILLSISLAIASAPSGVVLIDEVENGIHYSVMEKVWYAIGELAKINNTQIIASTHSWECIKSAHLAFSKIKNYPFCYHRLDRVKDKIKVVSYDQDTLQTSVEMNLEVR